MRRRGPSEFSRIPRHFSRPVVLFILKPLILADRRKFLREWRRRVHLRPELLLANFANDLPCGFVGTGKIRGCPRSKNAAGSVDISWEQDVTQFDRAVEFERTDDVPIERQLQ